MPDYVLYDLETTGTSSKYDEVIEISAVKVKNGVVTEEFSQLVNPGRPIPSAASAVNHITDDMVAFAPMFDSVLQQFLAFIGDDVLAGHNINRFDMKFLYRDCERYFGQTLTNDYIDTLKLARLCLPELSHHRLEDLAQYYGISTAGAHRALNDCRMNQQVFEKLAKELPQTVYSEVDPFSAEDASEVLEKLKHMKFWLAEERPIPYSHPWGMLIDNAYLRAGDWKLEGIRFDNLINLTYGTTIYIYNIAGENGEEPEDIYEILSSWYASASGTEFLDIYADLPENEKPKSGWDRALEELEEDSETK